VSAPGIHNQQLNKYQIMEKKTKTVQFQKEKDTKNTVKFAEVQSQGEAPIIGSLYVHIPTVVGHPFRFISDSHSNSKRTPVPIDIGQ
jgi:hypothetical protein